MAWRVPKGGPQVCDARRWPAPPCRASSGSPNRQPGVGCGTGAPARRTAQDDPLYDREIARSDRMGRVLGPHTDVDGIPRDHISGLLSGLVPGSPRTTGHERLSGDGHPAGATNSILATVKSHSAPRSSWHTTRSARGRRSAGGWIIRTSSLTGADPAARSRANTSAGSHGLASTVGASRAGRSRRVDAEHRCGRPEIVHQRRPGQGGDRPATTDPADQSPASRSGNRPVPPVQPRQPPAGAAGTPPPARPAPGRPATGPPAAPSATPLPLPPRPPRPCPDPAPTGQPQAAVAPDHTARERVAPCAVRPAGCRLPAWRLAAAPGYRMSERGSGKPRLV